MKITSKMRERYPVIDTPLFQAISLRIPKNKHKQLRDALQEVKTALGAGANLEHTRIHTAFIWSTTPQGHEYWRELGYIMDNGYRLNGSRVNAWWKAPRLQR